MTTLPSLQSHRRITASLIVATAICFLILAMRIFLLGRPDRIGIFANIGLAWIPYGMAHLVIGIMDHRPLRKGPLAAALLVWLLFLPNAAYIITDLVHWRKERHLPIWFDWIYISAIAWTGLFLGFLSVHLLQVRVESRWGSRKGWMFVLAALAASSFGIYAGRFFRWNSWDVLAHPHRIVSGVGSLTHSVTAWDALGFCGLFFVFSFAVYLMLHSLREGNMKQ